MTYNLYNVYKDGEIVLENARSKEVVRFTGCSENSVSAYAKDGTRIKGKYTVEISGTIQAYSSEIGKAFVMKYGRECYEQWLELNRRYGTKNK